MSLFHLIKYPLGPEKVTIEQWNNLPPEVRTISIERMKQIDEGRHTMKSLYKEEMKIVKDVLKNYEDEF